jgi:hypothetical protein
MAHRTNSIRRPASHSVFGLLGRRRFLALPCAFIAPAAAAPHGLTNFRFGILRSVGPSLFEFVRYTTRIPLRFKETGFRFGVGFDNPKRKEIEWYEIIRLPEEATEVSGNFQRTSRKPLRTKTFRSDRESVVDDFWFDPGDPLGKHTLELYVDGSLLFRVDFDVVPEG